MHHNPNPNPYACVLDPNAALALGKPGAAFQPCSKKGGSLQAAIAPTTGLRSSSETRHGSLLAGYEHACSTRACKNDSEDLHVQEQHLSHAAKRGKLAGSNRTGHWLAQQLRNSARQLVGWLRACVQHSSLQK
ncbi:hypothetical protein N9S81_00380 [bacterium]|nr:hypothetical protein [bacterium]